MIAPLWASLALLLLASAAFVLPRLPRERALALLVLAAAGVLAALRAFALAVPVAALGLGLWRRSAGAPPSPGRSEVESMALRMHLDHATGEMDGEVIAGPLAGRRLSGLAPSEIDDLRAAFEAAGDEDSLALLLAWLERTGRAHDPAPPPGTAAMTEAEAYRVLGLAPGASLEEIRAAYRRLMRRVHPDLGGSSALAAMLNAAKERLDPG